MAELSVFDAALPPEREATLRHTPKDLFPDGADMMAPSHFWSGLRTMPPHSTPIIGATPIPNLLPNTGHGTVGWPMAWGSGRLPVPPNRGGPPPTQPTRPRQIGSACGWDTRS